jgi:hypothetical protein
MRVYFAADLEADPARVQAANKKPPGKFLNVAATIERAHRVIVDLSASARRKLSMRIPQCPLLADCVEKLPC